MYDPTDPGEVRVRAIVRQALFPAPVLTHESTPIGSAFTLTVAGVFVQGLTRLGYSILVGRILGPTALGDLASVLALASFLILLWPAAGGNAAGKFIALARGENNSEVARATQRFVAISSVIAGAILGTVGALIVGLQFGAGWFGGLMAGALTLSLAAYNFSRGLRVGYGHFRATALWDIIASAVSLTMLIGVLVGGWEAVLLLPLIAGYSIFAITAWPFGRVQALPAGRRSEILRFTVWSSLNIMAAGGLLQLSIVLARQWSNGTELGFYSAAVQLATPASMLSGAMITAMGPALITRFASGDLVGMRSELDKIMKVTVAFFMPLFAVGVFWSPSLLFVVFGAEFSSGTLYLSILFIAVSATSFNASNARLNGTEARGIRELAAVNVAALVIGLGIMVWLGPAWGALGSAIGYLTGAIISSAVPFLIVWKRDSMTWLPVLARIFAAYAMMTAGLVGQHIVGRTLWWSAGCTVIFVAVWLLLNRPAFRDGVRTLRAMLLKRKASN